MTRATTPAGDVRTAVDKALSLLLSFEEDVHAGIGVSELARRAELSKSTAFRLLGILQRNGVVERCGSDYRLGVRLRDLTRQTFTPDQHRIRDVVTPFLAELYELTHETVQLAVLTGTDVLYLDEVYGHRVAPARSRTGGRLPAHCAAVGKVLLAYDEAALDELVVRPLAAWTSTTIDDPARLRRHLERVREEGVAFDEQETRPGVTSVAAPIFEAPGRAVAALSVSAPAHRMDRRAYAAAVRRTGRAAGRALAGQRSWRRTSA